MVSVDSCIYMMEVLRRIGEEWTRVYFQGAESEIENALMRRLSLPGSLFKYYQVMAIFICHGSASLPMISSAK